MIYVFNDAVQSSKVRNDGKNHLTFLSKYKSRAWCLTHTTTMYPLIKSTIITVQMTFQTVKKKKI